MAIEWLPSAGIVYDVLWKPRDSCAAANGIKEQQSTVDDQVTVWWGRREKGECHGVFLFSQFKLTNANHLINESPIKNQSSPKHSQEHKANLCQRASNFMQ